MERGGDLIVDQDRLVRELEIALQGRNYELRDSASHFSWGADGAALDIVLGVSTAVGGIAGTVYLVEKATQWLGKPVNRNDTEEIAMDRAKQRLCEYLHVVEDEITVDEVKRGGKEIIIRLKMHGNLFDFTMDKHGVSKMKRVGRRRKSS